MSASCASCFVGEDVGFGPHVALSHHAGWLGEVACVDELADALAGDFKFLGAFGCVEKVQALGFPCGSLALVFAQADLCCMGDLVVREVAGLLLYDRNRYRDSEWEKHAVNFFR